MANSYLVFDIETTALPYENFSESQQEYIVRRAVTDEEIAQKKAEMALSPLTSQVIVIGWQLMLKTGNDWNTEKRIAFAVDENLDGISTRTEPLSGGGDCHLYNEAQMLKMFWKVLDKYSNSPLISFNGRNFDAPYLMLRSALLGIRPSRDLMDGTKFNYSGHIDLLDKLCYYTQSNSGPTKRFNFDFYARAFGITSPKSEGIDGSKVTDYYREGKILEISEYCLRDVRATWELFIKWNDYLNFK
jgi:hypothetical protein